MICTLYSIRLYEKINSIQYIIIILLDIMLKYMATYLFYPGMLRKNQDNSRNLLYNYVYSCWRNIGRRGEYSQTSMARSSFGPLKFVAETDSSNH